MKSGPSASGLQLTQVVQGSQSASPCLSGAVVSHRAAWLLKQAQLKNLSSDKIECCKVIGYGLMGTVRMVKLKDSDFYFAIKSIRKDYILRHHDERHVESERELLMSLRSPFCIKLFGTFQDSVHLHLVMELAIGGELFRRLSKKEYFTPAVAKFYASEIFCALKHIHSLGYAYRDLKPENVMLDEDGHCKLVDFGFSKRPDENGIFKTNCGTPAYLSPEQLNGKFTNGYKAIVDWWSLGVFIYELMTGKTPFCKSNRESSYAIYLRILKNKISFPMMFDAASKELISGLCHPELEKRLVTAEAIECSPYWEIKMSVVGARKLVPPFVPRVGDSGDDRHFNDYNHIQKDLPHSTQSDSHYDFPNF